MLFHKMYDSVMDPPQQQQSSRYPVLQTQHGMESVHETHQQASMLCLKHFSVPALTNIWNFEVNSFAPYNTHLM